MFTGRRCPGSCRTSSPPARRSQSTGTGGVGVTIRKIAVASSCWYQRRRQSRGIADRVGRPPDGGHRRRTCDGAESSKPREESRPQRRDAGHSPVSAQIRSSSRVSVTLPVSARASSRRSSSVAGTSAPAGRFRVDSGRETVSVAGALDPGRRPEACRPFPGSAGRASGGGCWPGACGRRGALSNRAPADREVCRRLQMVDGRPGPYVGAKPALARAR